MLDIERRDVINYINSKINDLTFLTEFCKCFDNNPRRVVEGINLFIKICFFDKTSPYTMYINDRDLVNDRYREFLENNTSFFDRFKKSVDLNSFTIDLDSDLYAKHLIGLKTPSLGAIVSCCKSNREDNSDFDYRIKKHDVLLDSKRGFNDVGFLYSTVDEVIFDRNFCYYNAELTGNVDEDFYNLYKDFRYKNKPNSPLNNSFSDNVKSIRESQDFSLKKLGDVYEIINGRHRILYLIKNNYSKSIPVSVTKRFEDKELNILLRDFRKNNDVVVLKNNCCNDLVDLCFIYNDKLYRLSDRDSVFDFCNNIGDFEKIEKYFVCDFPVYKRSVNDEFRRCRKLVLDKFLNGNEDILDMNFTDILGMFNERSTYLYDAFNVLQLENLKFKLCGFDFKKYCLILEGVEDSISDDIDLKQSGVKK